MKEPHLDTDQQHALDLDDAPAGDQRTSDLPAAEASEDFEELYARLEAVAAQLEAGNLNLEQSIALYEEGMRLAQRCQALLRHVEQRIERLQALGDAERE